MYELIVANKRVKNKLREYIKRKPSLRNILDRLRINPRREAGAHPLKGILSGKWGCWLGMNIRAIYIIDDSQKRIFIEAIGTHKIY